MFFKSVLTSMIFVSSSLFAAGFDYGNYPGVDEQGEQCEVTFGSPAGYVNNYPGGAQGSVSLVRVIVFGEDYMILDKATLGPVYQSKARFDQTQTGTHLEIDLENREAFVYGHGVEKTCYY